MESSLQFKTSDITSLILAFNITLHHIINLSYSDVQELQKKNIKKVYCENSHFHPLYIQHTFNNKTYTLSIYHKTTRTMDNDGIFIADIIITGNTIPRGSHPLTEKLFRPNKKENTATNTKRWKILLVTEYSCMYGGKAGGMGGAQCPVTAQNLIQTERNYFFYCHIWQLSLCTSVM